MRWVVVGGFDASWALRVDSLSTIMMLVVGFISFLIHVYSVGYMSHDNSVPRFMAYLSLFTFAMLMLVTSDNLLQLFFGWEGVGVASYLLIGFWYEKPSACAAAMKAFIVNRVGDFGLVLGLAATFLVFDSIQYDVIFENVPKFAETTLHAFGGDFGTLNLIGVLLFIGAMGKSAQLGLHTWLPDAMEGPTPVSALIHAATMVTAGVFLVARFSPLFEYRAGRAGDGRVHRRLDRAVRGHDRPDPVRHQAGDRLLDLLAAGLHVLRRRRRRLRCGHLPPVHPCLLQGAAVPGLGLGDPCHVRRAGHAQDGRHLEAR